MITADILVSSLPDTVKVKRKRRTKAEMAFMPPLKMDLEKEYQAGRTSDLILPDADKGKAGEFFKKKREKKEPVEQ